MNKTQNIYKIIFEELEQKQYIELTHQENFNCINIKIGKQSKQIISVIMSLETDNQIEFQKAEYILEKQKIWEIIEQYILNIKEKNELINKLIMLYLKNNIKEKEYENLIQILKTSLLSSRIRKKYSYKQKC